jgi:hypothetical protein
VLRWQGRRSLFHVIEVKTGRQSLMELVEVSADVFVTEQSRIFGSIRGIEIFGINMAGAGN